MREEFTPPDERALSRLMEVEDAAALIICLAWRAGLKREEIRTLTWARVDLGAKLLRLPDRDVPLNDDAAAFLARWRERGEDDYVLASARHGGIVAPQWISWLSRRALDEAGLPDVDLGTLRLDFIRRELERREWPYVLRITGVTVENYRTNIAPRLAAPPRRGTSPPPNPPTA